MNRICAIIIYLFTAILAYAAEADDNVISPLCESTYIIHEKDGSITDVKYNTVTTYLATRHDDKVVDAIFYGDALKIDKVSAPGTKPIYRAYEGDEMFYTGSKVCFLPMTLEKGKEKKLVAERTYIRPEHFCDIPIRVRHFTKEYSVKIIVPKKIADRIKVKLINAPESMHIESQVSKDGSITYALKQTNMEAYKEEPMAPSQLMNIPSILITGYFENLQSLYRYLKNFCGEEDTDSIVVQDLAQRVTANCTTDIERIDSIADWVRQNIRYLAIEHGDYAMKPDLPSHVIKKRFGDCKCSANLIKQMMRSVGIDGRLVWVGTNDEVITEWEDVPALCSGNHMIAAALLPDTIIYVDGTSAYSPAGFISAMISGRTAMIEDGDSYMLAKIPQSGDTKSILHANFTIENDDLVGRMTNTVSGLFKMGFARSYFKSDSKKREDLLRRWLIYPKKNVDCENGAIELIAPAADDIKLSADVVDKGAAKHLGDIIYVDLLPVRDFQLEPVELKNRKYGVSIPYNYQLSTRFVLTIPDGYSLRELPEISVFDSEWFKGNIEYSINDNTVICKAEINYFESMVPLSQVSDWNNALKSINQASRNQIVLIKK